MSIKKLESLVDKITAYTQASPAERQFLETYDEIEGSTLSRIWQYTQKKECSFGIISGFVTDSGVPGSREEGVQNTMEIARKARALGFGYVWLSGYWAPENQPQVQEDSILVYGKNGQEAALKEFLTEMRDSYRQTAFAFKPEGSDTLYGMYKDGPASYGRFQPDRLGENYSRLKGGKHAGRSFVFASYWGLQTPSNHQALMVRLRQAHVIT